MIQLETKVVNLRKQKCNVKIGRHKGQVSPVPQQGCFGNPYPVEVYGRDG